MRQPEKNNPPRRHGVEGDHFSDRLLEIIGSRNRSTLELSIKSSVLAFLLLTGIWFTGCSRNSASQNRASSNNSAQAAQAAETAVVEVPVAQALVRPVPTFIQATGSLVGAESSDVASEVAGQVVATPVDVGSYVRRGAILARLNDRDARLRLQQAKAAEAQAVAALRQAEWRVGGGRNAGFDENLVPEARAAKAAYESAEAQARLAEANAKRYANLVETGDVSKSVYDEARTRAEMAAAQARVAKEQYEAALNTARQGNQGVISARANLEAARAQVAIAEKALADTVIRAPFAGYISDRPIAAGEHVTLSTKIVTLVRTDSVKALLQFPEGEAGQLRPGLSASISVAAYSNRQFAGTVVAVNPSIDAQSRSLVAEVEIPNSENLLRPGMFANGRIVLSGSREGVFAPDSAVFVDQTTNSSHVYAIEENVARLRVVQVGEQESGMIRILSGLNAGETVATGNLAQLFDGASVRARP